MDIDVSALERTQEIPLEHPHESRQYHQIHARPPQRLDISPFGVFIELGAKFPRRDKLPRQLPLTRMAENTRCLDIAQNNRDLGRDSATRAGISNRHKIRAFARTKHADAKFSPVSHGL